MHRARIHRPDKAIKFYRQRRFDTQPLADACLVRMADPPYVFGSVLTLAGYTWASARKKTRVLPQEAQAFLQEEQLGRLRGVLRFKG